jgi:hypothetical protein
MTTRTEFLERLDKEFQRIREIFTERNKSYGKDEDLFHNFRQSAIRHFGDDSSENMFKVAEILVDKHNVALANKGANDPVCDERPSDRIVYSLIEKAMLLEKERLKVRGAENIAGESRGWLKQ